MVRKPGLLWSSCSRSGSMENWVVVDAVVRELVSWYGFAVLQGIYRDNSGFSAMPNWFCAFNGSCFNGLAGFSLCFRTGKTILQVQGMCPG